MNLVDILKTELGRDEGVCTEPYDCPAGARTTGVGRNLDANPLTAAEVRVIGHDGRTKPISRGNAFWLLDNDINRTRGDLDRALPWWKTLDEVRRRALINMAYNLGVPRLLGFRKMLAALKAGSYEAAAREAMDSLWSRQVGDRAQRIAHMLRYGVAP